MFSGIIKGCGRIVAAESRGGDLRLDIDTTGVDLGAVGAGDSIAVNGVCLTALDPAPGRFAADVSAETLARTTLGSAKPGDRVNLEASLRLGQTIDGNYFCGSREGGYILRGDLSWGTTALGFGGILDAPMYTYEITR